MYLFLTVLGICCCSGFSLVLESGSCSWQRAGLSLRWLLFLRTEIMSVGHLGFNSCGMWAQQFPGSKAQAQ